MRKILFFLVLFSVPLMCGSAVGDCLFDGAGDFTDSVEMKPLSEEMRAGISGELISKAISVDRPVGNYNSYSPLKEGGYSFLLPGLGQYRMGKKLRAKIYFGLEGLGWIAMGSFLWQGIVKESTYKDYAVIYAGVSGTDHCDDYWNDVGRYESSYQYNQEVVNRTARDLYPDDVEAQNAYKEAHQYIGYLQWDWRSSTAFHRYKSLKNDTRAAYRRSLYSVIFVLTLRVVSSVDAVRIARSGNASDNGGNQNLSLEFDRFHQGFSLAIQKKF